MPNGIDEFHSAFLDVLVLHGLGELTLAEGDVKGAAITFAEAFAAVVPTDLVGTSIAGSATMAWFENLERLADLPSEPREIPPPLLESPGVSFTREASSHLSVTIDERLAWRRGMPQGEGGSGSVASFAGAVTGMHVSEWLEALGREGGSDGEFGRVGADYHWLWASAMRQAAPAVLPGLLAGAAKAAAAADTPGSAARLLGAAEAARNAAPMLHRQARWMLFEHRYVEAVERARTVLGEDAFAAAFAAGQTMRSDDAFLFALETLRDLQG